MPVFNAAQIGCLISRSEKEIGGNGYPCRPVFPKCFFTKKSEMNSWYVLLAVAAGAVLPVQVGVNTTLRNSLGNPIVAALVSFAVGSACLLAYALATRATWPTMQMLAKPPLWAWTGGAVGAFFVATTIIVAPKLGAANLVALTIAAQLIGSLLLDHYGLIGFAQHSLNTTRLIGALLLIAGTVMIVRN